METWLIHVTENGAEKIHKFDEESKACEYIGHVALGHMANTRVQNIKKVDCATGDITALEPDIDDYRIVLVKSQE